MSTLPPAVLEDWTRQFHRVAEALERIAEGLERIDAQSARPEPKARKRP